MDSFAHTEREISDAWEIITKWFSPETHQGSISHNDLTSALHVLRRYQIDHIVIDWYMEMVQKDLKENIFPEFWKAFNEPNADMWTFTKAVSTLHESFNKFMPSLDRLDCLYKYLIENVNLQSDAKMALKKWKTPLKYGFQGLLQTFLFQDVPVSFNKILIEFYDKIFSVFEAHYNKSLAGPWLSEEDMPLQCNGCNFEVESCNCKNMLDKFRQSTVHLQEMNLLEGISQDAALIVVQLHIGNYIHETCKGNFESSYLAILEKWLSDVALNWLYEVNPSFKTDDAFLKEKLIYIMQEKYTEVRMEQMFNIIIEFPESLAAVQDLQICLQKINLRPKLIKTLRQAFERRLLHQGVNTSDILTAYVSAIKALRVLDSSGVVLQQVCEPVCKYLRQREDTVRCIISSLLDENSCELSQELSKSSPLVLEDSYQSDEEPDNWEKWQPEPIDADPTKISKIHKSSDIISMLVNIYGTKDLFINEYRTLLANRLLTTFNFSCDRELRYLEMLKARFGEGLLHLCEVMLKDIRESEKFNEQIQKGEIAVHDPSHMPVKALIASVQFWPTFNDEKLKLPDKVAEGLKNYTKAFETMKGNRTLEWKPYLGQVTIEVELRDRVLELQVMPIQACIIYYFQEKSKWTLEALASTLEVAPYFLRRKISYWLSQGVIEETQPDVFTLVEEKKQGQIVEMVLEDAEEDKEMSTASTKEQEKEEMNLYWSFVTGMLTNLDSLPLERIHTMLKMFAPNVKDISIRDLRHFLDTKVREQALVFTGGQYRLPSQPK